MNTLHSGFAIYELLEIGDKHLAISKEDFTLLSRSQDVIARVSEFEESFWSVCEGFRNLQEECLKLALKTSMFGLGFDSDFLQTSSEIGGKLDYYLVAVRRYIDRLPHLFSLITSELAARENVKSLLSEIYDRSPEYRLLSDLRDYSAHKKTAAANVSRNLRNDMSRNIKYVHIGFWISVRELLNWNKAKSRLANRTRQDIKSMGIDDKINLLQYCKVQLASIGKLHSDLRKKMLPFEECALGHFRCFASKYIDKYPEPNGTPITLVARRNFDGRKWFENEDVDLIRETDKFTVFIRNQTTEIGNIDKKIVLSDQIPI